MLKGAEHADFEAFKNGEAKPSETVRVIYGLTGALAKGLAEMDERLRKLEGEA